MPVRCFPGLFHKPIPAFTPKPLVLSVCPHRWRRGRGRSAPEKRKKEVPWSPTILPLKSFHCFCFTAPIPAGSPSHTQFPAPAKEQIQCRQCSSHTRTVYRQMAVHHQIFSPLLKYWKSRWHPPGGTGSIFPFSSRIFSSAETLTISPTSLQVSSS